MHAKVLAHDLSENCHHGGFYIMYLAVIPFSFTPSHHHSTCTGFPLLAPCCRLVEDTAWHPIPKEQMEKWGPVQRSILRTFLGSPLKLWASVGHWAVWHFDVSLYTERQKPKVCAAVSLSAHTRRRCSSTYTRVTPVCHVNVVGLGIPLLHLHGSTYAQPACISCCCSSRRMTLLICLNHSITGICGTAWLAETCLDKLLMQLVCCYCRCWSAWLQWLPSRSLLCQRYGSPLDLWVSSNSGWSHGWATTSG